MRQKHPLTAVLTGGPGVGKTSIIQDLRSRGFQVREEVFTRLFADTQREGRFNEKYLHSPEIVHDLLEAQKKLEDTPHQEPVLFLDRCRVDIFGFIRNLGTVPFEKDLTELTQGQYDWVFIIAPLPARFYDQNKIRRQSHEESLVHHKEGIQSYLEFQRLYRPQNPFKLVEVPFHPANRTESVEWRTDFILDHLGLKSRQL